ncbi:hypothetical protein D3C78_1538060 [compost metagenome]
MRRCCPPTVHAANQLGFTRQRRFPRTDNVRTKKRIGAARLQRQRLGGIIFGINRSKRFEALLLVFGIPCQQDRLLVRAGTDDNAQTGDVFSLFKLLDRAG